MVREPLGSLEGDGGGGRDSGAAVALLLDSIRNTGGDTFGRRVVADDVGLRYNIRRLMPVSLSSSRLIYDALKGVGVRVVSALPETWLVHLIRMAEDDPEMILVRLAKEEEGVGISTGAHFAGVKSAMLMQNHGFLASVNGIVSCAQLYRIQDRKSTRLNSSHGYISYAVFCLK